MVSRFDKRRLDNLFVPGVEEVSWRKGPSYVTLVSNHTTGKFISGKEGKDTDTLDSFFDELGEQRSAAITAMLMDTGPAYEKSAKKEGHAVNAVICYDPFHADQLVTTALDQIRRSVWQDLRKLTDQEATKRFRGARWALLKNPTDLTDDQAATLRKLKRRGGDLWRVRPQGGLRAVFAGYVARSQKTPSVRPSSWKQRSPPATTCRRVGPKGPGPSPGE